MARGRRCWTDLDEGSRTLLVETKFERETGLGIVEGPTKAQRPRSSVPASEHAVGVLRVHAGHYAEEKQHAGSAYHDDGLICCWEDGARYDLNWGVFQKWLDRGVVDGSGGRRECVGLCALHMKDPVVCM